MSNDKPDTELLDSTDSQEAIIRRNDPELLIMGRIVPLLDDMQPIARSRVVAWLNSRYTE